MGQSMKIIFKIKAESERPLLFYFLNMKISFHVLPCIKHLTLRMNHPSGDYRMNISRMIIMSLIFGLLGPYYAYADQPFRLEAKEGSYQLWTGFQESPRILSNLERISYTA